MVPPFQAAIWLPGLESRHTFDRHFPMGGVIYLSLVVRRVVRFRLSHYGQGEPGSSAAALLGNPCELAGTSDTRAPPDTLAQGLRCLSENRARDG